MNEGYVKYTDGSIHSVQCVGIPFDAWDVFEDRHAECPQVDVPAGAERGPFDGWHCECACHGRNVVSDTDRPGWVDGEPIPAPPPPTTAERVQVVWKTTLTTHSEQPRDLPADARVVAVRELVDGAENEDIGVWFVCSRDAPLVTRRFRVVPTGQQFHSAGWEYRGTAVFDDPEVFHVFEATS